MRRLAPLLVIVFMVVSACGGDTTGDTSGAPSTTGGASPTTDAGGATSTLASTETTTTTVVYPSIVDDLGLPIIEQFTPTSGGGNRPDLEWAAVENAAHYFVVVSAPSGAVYWAWRTDGTSIPVGGLPRLAEQSPGPAVSLGMTWSVTAMDDGGAIIAVSAIRPIAP